MLWRSSSSAALTLCRISDWNILREQPPDSHGRSGHLGRCWRRCTHPLSRRPPVLIRYYPYSFLCIGRDGLRPQIYRLLFLWRAKELRRRSSDRRVPIVQSALQPSSTSRPCSTRLRLIVLQPQWPFESKRRNAYSCPIGWVQQELLLRCWEGRARQERLWWGIRWDERWYIRCLCGFQ